MWNVQQQEVFDSLEDNLFITGPGGTGKSLILTEIYSLLPEQTLVVAPTGIAALQIRGLTIHKAFRLHELPGLSKVEVKNGCLHYFDYSISYSELFKSIELKEDVIVSYKTPQVLRTLVDLAASMYYVKRLIIDEVSMMSADIFETIDLVLRLTKNSNQPMGGVQVLLFGDFMQLRPVAKYRTDFAFKSKLWSQLRLKTISLDIVVRQEDAGFVSILNKIRFGNIDKDVFDLLTQRRLTEEDDVKDWIHLHATNDGCDIMNQKALDAIQRISITYHQHIVKGVTEEIPKYAFGLVPPQITLKVGAKVLLVRNGEYNEMGSDRKIPLCNGHIGVVVRLREHSIDVRFKGVVVTITRQFYQYRIYKHGKWEVVTSIRQFPLIHGWAITIHKSQGMTLERAVIHLDNISFSGQLYVALSRVKTQEGLKLMYSKLLDRIFKVDQDAKAYYGQ